jgi:signal transduction histidine kinase/HD-like signal output (HDOD) protein
MKSENALLKQLSTLNNLPTLPHILLKLIDACNRDSQDLGGIAEMVGSDPALSAKILKLVNSAYFGLPRKVESIGEAVVLVGTSGIKNLAMCACVHDAFPTRARNGSFSLKTFWWHSLRCAFLARQMASEWDVCPPDDAFLSGLLHDIGKVVLWVNFTKPYASLLETAGNDSDRLLAGEAHMGATHADVGAWLLDGWQLDPSIADCVRYHHEPPDRIAHAFGMVQVVHVANLLCQDRDSDIQAGLATVHRVLGREPMAVQALLAESDQEAAAVARSLNIDVGTSRDPAAGLPDENDQAVQDRLAGEVRNLSLLVGTLEGFVTAEDRAAILKCIADGLNILFDARRILFFLIDEKAVLAGHIPDKAGRYVSHHALAVSMKMKQSLLVRSLVEQRPLDSLQAASTGPLTIVDQQLVRLLGGSAMVCLPLVAHADPVGVIALGIDSDDLPHLFEHTSLLNVFIHKGALALRLDNLRRRQLQAVQATRMDASSDLARRVVHEVNNPLGIIKNYLKVLGVKMDEAGIEHDALRIINEEITRVGQLLSRLTAFSKQETPQKAMADINALLEDILALVKVSLLSAADIHLHAELEKDLPAVAGDPDSLKQVFINLIKNAAEAMAGGGTLEVRTRHHPPPIGAKGQHAGGYVEIIVRDDGPGIPEAIREKLFDPYVSTKSGRHAGLGLSVVYNTIQSLQGTIFCESTPGEGTVFIVELPVKPG